MYVGNLISPPAIFGKVSTTVFQYHVPLSPYFFRYKKLEEETKAAAFERERQAKEKGTFRGNEKHFFGAVI